jgi:hypothetical protein
MPNGVAGGEILSSAVDPLLRDEPQNMVYHRRLVRSPPRLCGPRLVETIERRRDGPRHNKLDHLIAQTLTGFWPQHSRSPPSGIQALIDTAIAGFDGTDVLINNAGCGIVGVVEETFKEELLAVMVTRVVQSIHRAAQWHDREHLQPRRPVAVSWLQRLFRFQIRDGGTSEAVALELALRRQSLDCGVWQLPHERRLHDAVHADHGCHRDGRSNSRRCPHRARGTGGRTAESRSRD